MGQGQIPAHRLHELKGVREAVVSLCLMMKRPTHSHTFNVDGRTARHLHLLCNRYDLSENKLITMGLELAELKLAEFEIRLTVQLEDWPDES